MALIKIINVGDEIQFGLGDLSPQAKEISIMLVEKAGRQAVLRISADRSIPIKHFRQERITGESGKKS
ncbi:MAG: hypothetical protein Q8P12_01020 [bacterium]|nr:hypothetical protein [bacterium]